MMLIGVIVYGLGLLGISIASNLVMFYIGFIFLGLGTSLAIAMVPQTMLARWFKNNLGKAAAVVSMGGAIGGLFVPVVVKMIDAYGWQNSFLILALVMWLIGIPLYFVFRAKPEQHGLLTDDKTKNNVKGLHHSQNSGPGVSVREALKMRAFWQIGLSYMLQLGSIHAVTIHVMPYLASLGVERSTASMVAMLIPLVSFTARIPFGWLADTFRKTYVMGVSVSLTIAGLLLFWLIDGSSAKLIYLFVIVFGLGMAGPGPVRTPIVREYFGTKNFGTIFGLIKVFSMIGLLVYPPLAGWVYDTFNSYKIIWLIYGVGCLVGAILMVTAPLPKKEVEVLR